MKVGDKVFVKQDTYCDVSWEVAQITRETATQWVVLTKNNNWRFRKNDLRGVGDDTWVHICLLSYEDNLAEYNAWVRAKNRKQLIGKIQSCNVATSLTNEDLREILARLEGETK